MSFKVTPMGDYNTQEIGCLLRGNVPQETKREASQVFSPPYSSPYGESGKPDGGWLTGRVLACSI